MRKGGGNSSEELMVSRSLIEPQLDRRSKTISFILLIWYLFWFLTYLFPPLVRRIGCLAHCVLWISNVKRWFSSCCGGLLTPLCPPLFYSLKSDHSRLGRYTPRQLQHCSNKGSAVCSMCLSVSVCEIGCSSASLKAVCCFRGERMLMQWQDVSQGMVIQVIWCFYMHIYIIQHRLQKS